MEPAVPDIDAVILFKDSKSYIFSGDVETPVHLKEYRTLEVARDIWLSLQQCRNCYVAWVFPPFRLNGKNYLATKERGTSLQTFLSSENKRRLVDFQDSIAFQASLLYKKIVRFLVILARSLIEENLQCSFDLDRIFLIEKGNDIHVEATDFNKTDEGSKVWHGLGACLSQINDKLATLHYHADDDIEMSTLVKHLKTAVGGKSLDNLVMKSIFFWDWTMKRDYVCKAREYIESDFEQWNEKFNQGFDNDWESKINQDADLKKFFNLYKSKKPSGSVSWPVQSIRSSFAHFYTSSDEIRRTRILNINNMEELQNRYEFNLGHYTHKSVAENLIDLQRPSLDFKAFTEATIWKDKF